MGCLSVKALLEQAGHRVTLFNFPGESGSCHTPPLPKELNYLKPWLIPDETGPVSWFRQRKHFGPPVEDCTERILNARPERVMLSCFAWCYAEEARRLASELKRRAPDLPLEIGGAGVSVNPEWFRRTGLFDEVRCGEAERNMADFPGMPAAPPAVTPVLTRVGNYRGQPQFSTMLTRGCPYRCRFCANHLTHGREFRKIPPEELLLRLEKTGEEVFHLNLEDDNLLADRDYFTGFLDRFHTRYPRATLSAENGLDYRRLTPPLLSRLIEGGFIRFNLSMASADSRILSGQNRSGGGDQLTEVLHLLKQKGIPAVTYFICGLEGDTVESVCRNLLFLAERPTEIGISPFYAVPGLPGFEHPGEKGLPEYPPLYCGSSVWPWNGNLTTGQLITAFRLSRFINLLKSPVRASWEELIDRTLENRRIHTVCGRAARRTIREVPHMDREMSREVIASIS